MSSTRTPGTGGVIDLWKNNDGTPSKLATGRWVGGRGRPQGVGKRWRGWYVGDDGKTRTTRFRTEAETEAWANAPPAFNSWGFKRAAGVGPRFDQWGFCLFGVWIPL
jgi:hypothetical protein